MKVLSVATFGLILSAQLLAAPSPLQNYLASVVPKNKVVSAFSKMKTNTKSRSQCFNRAYVWSHELLKTEGIYSKKVLIYYTNKYRELLDPKWGFHIAPVVVMENMEEVGARAPYPTEMSELNMQEKLGQYFGGKEDTAREIEQYAANDGTEMNVVMDREFAQVPLTLHQWTRKFITFGEQTLEVKRQNIVFEIKKMEGNLAGTRNADRAATIREKLREKRQDLAKIKVNENSPAEIKCKLVEQIDVFDNLNRLGEDGSEFCLIQLVSMNYWNPIDLRELVYEGIESHKIEEARLWTARKQAFENWRSIWPTNKDIDDEIDEMLKNIDKKFDEQLKLAEENFKGQIKDLESQLKKLKKADMPNPIAINAAEEKIKSTILKKTLEIERIENAKNMETQKAFQRKSDLMNQIGV